MFVILPNKRTGEMSISGQHPAPNHATTPLVPAHTRVSLYSAETLADAGRMTPVCSIAYTNNTLVNKSV